MEFYHFQKRAYQIGRDIFKIGDSTRQNWEVYPLPPLPEKRRMLRTVQFISEHQGYIFGGDLKEPSTGYILETLDGGKSWQTFDLDLPHIHYSLKIGQDILLAGKDGLLKKWIPAPKNRKSRIHQGDASRILIDGKIEKNEWLGANKTMIQKGIDLYTLQDEHYLYLSIQYDTTMFANYYADLYFGMGKDSLLNIHASQQLGERVLIGSDWTDSTPAFNWGYINNWAANTSIFDRKNKRYLPYTAIEFQIAKNKLPENLLKVALQTRDINWEKEVVNVPKDGDFTSTTKDWLHLYWE